MNFTDIVSDRGGLFTFVEAADQTVLNFERCIFNYIFSYSSGKN